MASPQSMLGICVWTIIEVLCMDSFDTSVCTHLAYTWCGDLHSWTYMRQRRYRAHADEKNIICKGHCEPRGQFSLWGKVLVLFVRPEFAEHDPNRVVMSILW